MSTKIATLFAEIGADTTKFDRGARDTKRGLSDLRDGFEALTGVTVGAAAGIGALVAGLKYSTAQAMESEKVMAATEATIRATGGAAGMTADEISDLASSESRLTAIDDEVIQSGANMLLTFKNIGENTFPRATRAMEDMAAAMANGNIAQLDLQSTAILLGKALNDPIAGIGALTKNGVTLSDVQKQQIRDFMAVNDVASAQAVILAELESEFGGMAEAMGGTNLGKIQKAKNELDNLAATIGEKLLPFLGDAAAGAATLMSAQDRLSSAFQAQEQRTRETAGSYEEYITEVQRAYAASHLYGVRQEVLVRQGDALSEANFNAAKAGREAKESFAGMAGAAAMMKQPMQDAAEEADIVKGKMSELGLFMAGDVGQSFVDFSDKMRNLGDQQNEIVTKISELESKAWLTPEQRQQLEDLRGKLDDNKNAVKEAADAFEKESKRIVFSILQQRLASDGLTKTEADALVTVAQKFGLIDQATKMTYDAIGDVVTQLDEGKISADGMADAIERISDKNVKIGIEYTESGVYNPYGNRVDVRGGAVSGENANGGVIMAGETRLVGERGPEMISTTAHAQVTTAETLSGQQQGTGGAGGQIIIYGNPTISLSGDTQTMLQQVTV